MRDFVFRSLLFESEVEKFNKAGIKIGADGGKVLDADLAEILQPFNVTRRNNALEMARLYALIHCFENELRELVQETLEEKVGLDWWDKIPRRIRDHAESRKKSALKESWLEGEKSNLLSFIEFGHLADIMIEFWPHFEDIIPSQQWLKQRMDEIEKSRHFIAHNRTLLPSEFQRLYMYISDWNKIIGL